MVPIQERETPPQAHDWMTQAEQQIKRDRILIATAQSLGVVSASVIGTVKVMEQMELS